MPKYLVRMLIFTLLLVAAPVILIGMTSYYIASHDIEKKVNEGNQQILQQNQMRLEQVFKSVEMAAVQYLNSSLVMDYIYDDLSQDDFQTIANISKGLYNLHSLSAVADTHLINLDNDWMISNYGFTSTEDYANRDLLNGYAANNKNLFWLASGVKGQESIRLVVKLPMIASSTQPKALLIIDMQHGELETYLMQNTQWGHIYVLNQDQVPFLSSPGAIALQESIRDKLVAKSAAASYLEVEGLAVNYQTSAYNNWTYASVVSIQEITKESRKIALITLNACLIIFVMIAAAAFYGSRRMYTPIRRLFVIMEQLGGGSGNPQKEDEFAFIEERFHTLFSTRKEFQQQLQGQRAQMKEFFLLRLFMGQITESEFTYKCEVYGFAEKGKALGVLALQMDSLHETRYMERDKELLLFAVNNIVGELIPSDHMIGNLLLDQSQVSLLLGDSEDPKQLDAYFHERAKQIKAKVYELLQLKVSIGISRSFYRYTDAMNGYAEALEALKRRISLGNDIILHYNDVESGHGHRDHPMASIHHLEDYVVNALKAGDAEAVEAHYDHYVASIKDKGIAFNDFQMIMIQLINRIYHMVQQQGEALDTLTGSNSVVRTFTKLNTVEDISAWFKTELFIPTLVFLKERVDSQYINIAHQMIQMVQDRYEQDISLESCAAQLKFHPVYLSRVFKKEVGVTFIEYLIDYRMNMAKMWLKDTNLKITEIAERLNYTNSTGFIRTFRKVTGMTPGQYREEQANK
ncbi:helix-turn-helix transcriptional regulator [Paenibacillus agricola]|uniref:Helix-turn-helix transcriptional regulator n=1 Tax=Paenibacillus agricola TaxID=2716264 RepID=A0ABX0JG96_9BACL|nr:AraC family transcriptional regulator [Paenibacillus agricola]NHN34264.1 helix-turn-helix transcriptional regulator [Paenibacillus agricola]